MSGVVYSVEVQYLSSGSLGLEKAGAQIGSTDKMLGGLAQSIIGFGKSASDSFFGAMLKMEGLKIAMEGAGAVIDFIKDGVTGIHQEMENAGIAFAGMFQAAGRAKNLDEGLGLSQEILKQMRIDARELPGEFTDIVEVFQLMGQTALRSGMSIREAEHLSAQTMAFAATFGISNNIAGRELSAMISGTAQGRMPLFQKLLGGMEAKEFNRKSLKERIELITDAFGKYDDAIKSHAHSFTGLVSTLKDNIHTLLQMPITQSIFDKIKNSLEDVNGWFNRNQTSLLEWSHGLGKAFGDTFDQVKGIFSVLDGVIRDFMRKSSPENLAMAMKKTGMGIPAILGGIGVGGSIGAGVGGILGTLIGTIFGPGGAMLGGAAGAVAGGGVGAVAGGGMGAAIAGMFSGLFDTTSPFHQAFQKMWDVIIVNSEKAYMVIADIWERIKNPLMNISEAMGVVFLDSLVRITEFVLKAATLIDSVLSSEIIQNVLNYAGINLGFREHHVGYESTKGRYNEDLKHKIETPGEPVEPPAHNTYINKVEIQVLSNQDPSRIARLTLEEIEKIARNPTRANNTGRPNFSGPNFR